MLSKFFKANPTIKLWIVAENIRSAYNIGAMFRTADGAGGTGLILLGYSPTPENQKVRKTSLGAEQSVPYTFIHSTKEFLDERVPFYTLEICSRSTNIFDFKYSAKMLPLVLVVGNEVTGISAELLSKSRQSIFIPMNGKKESLNVAEATSIAIYEFYRKRTTHVV